MVMDGSTKFRFNPNACIFWLDTSLRDRMYQLRIGEQRYRINENTLTFLRKFQEAREERELDRALQGHPDGLKKFLVEKHILVEDTGEHHETENTPKHPLAFRLSLFSQRSLEPLTTRMAVLFSPVIVLLGVVFILFSHALFFCRAYPALHSVPSLSEPQWIAALFACYCLILFHELGHSSACTRYGARHDDIGIGIYFIYPVFYANVTDCWRLPRHQRAIVDAAGLYFQLLLSGACGLFWIVNPQPVLFVVVYSSLATALVNLNPFLRFDGYWLLTDITGLPSLHRSNWELCRYLVAKIRRKAGPMVIPEIFSAPRWVTGVVVFYCVCALSFFALFFARLILLFIPYVVSEYPKTVSLLWQMLMRPQFNSTMLHVAFRFFGLSATCFGLIMMLRGPVGWVTFITKRRLTALLSQRQEPETHMQHKSNSIAVSPLKEGPLGKLGARADILR
jgi:putative peptide zinc metalloprotease protein